MQTPELNYLEINRQLWNNKTEVHIRSDFYNLENFKKGGTSLAPIELEQLGDVRGKSLLHLQCHFGMDTLSWARRGANVTGVDLSDKAIATAQQLAKDLKIDARFICCDIYDLPKYLDAQFDIVFTSYGTIGWLPDLKPWGEVIARYLKPGGEFHFIEFHPMVWMFDDDLSYVQYSYFNKEAIVEVTNGTYADRSAPLKDQSISWNHSLSDVFQALLDQGLSIEQFTEYDWSPYNIFPRGIEIEPGKWQTQGMEGKLPMIFALKAVNVL